MGHSSHQLPKDFLGLKSVQLDQLVAGRSAANQFNPVPAAVEGIRQEPKQGLVGGRVDWRLRDLDPEFIALWFSDCVCGCARLKFDRQDDAVGVGSQKAWQGHGHTAEGK